MAISVRDHEVSVVIPAYNAAATLPRAIESVLTQTLPAKELLIIDDGSQQDLSDLLARYPSQVRWIHQSNQGAAAARNHGIDLARGSLVAFLDADDYWEPDKLQQQASLYSRYPQLGLTCSRYFEQVPGGERRLVSPTIRGLPNWDVPVRPTGRAAFDAACCVWTGTVMVPRAQLGALRFETGLEPAEDRELWIRLIQVAPSLFHSRPLATAVLEPGSLSRTQIDRDCHHMLAIIARGHSLLGASGSRFWRRRVYRRWAAEYLGQREPSLALRPAWRRLSIEPWSLEAWWIAAKSTGWSAAQRSLPWPRRS